MVPPNKIARTTQTVGVHSLRPGIPPIQIADLPEAVFHHILSFLSLKDLARMALCWKPWRYICHTTAYLTIDDVGTPTQNPIINHHRINNYMCFVERLLVLRRGVQIDSFRFVIPPINLHRAVTMILSVILYCKVQELDLTFSKSMAEVGLPREIFNLSSLKVLKLDMVERDFTLPANVELKNLESFSLSHAKIPEDAFHSWIATQCNSLKTLSFLDCSGFTTLNIISASLEKIHIREPKDNGNLLHIDISCQKLTTLHIELYSVQDRRSFRLLAPDLQILTWSGRAFSHCPSDSSPLTSLQTATMNVSYPPVQTATTNFSYSPVHWKIPPQFGTKFFTLLSHVKSLHLCSLSMQVLSHTLMTTSSLSLSKVESLELGTHFSMEENHYMFFLLWRLSNLKAFVANQEIDTNGSLPFTRLMPISFMFKCQKLEFSHLKTSEIRLHGSGGKGSGENILALVKHLLNRANMLEKMTVKYSQKDFSKKIRSRATEFTDAKTIAPPGMIDLLRACMMS